MKLSKAFEIVLQLAIQNQVDERDNPTEARRQEKAINLVWEYKENEYQNGRFE